MLLESCSAPRRLGRVTLSLIKLIENYYLQLRSRFVVSPRVQVSIKLHLQHANSMVQRVIYLIETGHVRRNLPQLVFQEEELSRVPVHLLSRQVVHRYVNRIRHEAQTRRGVRLSYRGLWRHVLKQPHTCYGRRAQAWLHPCAGGLLRRPRASGHRLFQTPFGSPCSVLDPVSDHGAGCSMRHDIVPIVW